MIRVRAVPAVDTLERGDQRVVLVPGRAVRVMGIALPLLDMVADWRTLPEIAAGLERMFGPVPGGDAEGIALAAARELRAQGLVEIDD